MMMDDIKRVQLSEIAELITKGTTPTTLGYEFQDSGVNFLKIECFDENGVFIKNKVTHISKECHEKLKRSQLKNGDILFSIAGAIGRVAIVTEEMLPANTNQALSIIRITNEEVYLPYIKLILTTPIVKDQFEKKKQGVAQLNLSLKDINEISIPLPNIEKQIELAELFGKVANVIARRNEEIKSLDELIKARFVELFGDFIEAENPVDFESICEFVTVGIANSATHAFCDDGVIMFRNQNIKEDYLDTADIVHITTEFASKYKTKMLKKDDLLIVRTGYPGVACLVPEQYEGCQTFTTLIARLKDAATVTPRFVCHYINSEYGKKYVKDNSAGAAQQNFGATALSKLPICIPPIELQNEYIRFVEQTDKSKFAVQKSLEEAQLLFDSLMQKYFG